MISNPENHYRLMWETWVGGLPWQYDFEAPSDRFAIDYAKRHAETSAGFRVEALAMLLFRLDDPQGVGEAHLARFVLDRPTARNTLEATP